MKPKETKRNKKKQKGLDLIGILTNKIKIVDWRISR
jgi:hypothetical protein